MPTTTDDLTSRDDLLTGVVVALCRRLADARGITVDGRELLIEVTADELLDSAAQVGVELGVSTDRRAVLLHVTPPTIDVLADGDPQESTDA